MSEQIKTKGIGLGTLFKILFIGLALSLGPLIIIFGIFALFGYGTITVNNEIVTGGKGLLASIIMAPIFSIVFAGIGWVFIAFGLWLFTRFKALTIRYKPIVIKE